MACRARSSNSFEWNDDACEKNYTRLRKPQTPRPWIEELFAKYRPTRDQAERIADRHYPNLSGREREDWIKARVARVGLVQDDVAALVNTSQNNISKLITGERGQGRMKRIQQGAIVEPYRRMFADERPAA